MPLQKNIVLIGFMGSGKSSLARLLAKKLDWPIVNTDKEVEQAAGMPITQIFSEKGEAFFRSLEADIVKSTALLSGHIIDCGGGVILSPENVAQLKRQGKIYWLDVRPEVVYLRLQHDHQRPLLQVPNPQEAIKELLKQRIPLYQHAADVIVDANDPSLEIPLVEILKRH